MLNYFSDVKLRTYARNIFILFHKLQLYHPKKKLFVMFLDVHKRDFSEDFVISSNIYSDNLLKNM